MRALRAAAAAPGFMVLLGALAACPSSSPSGGDGGSPPDAGVSNDAGTTPDSGSDSGSSVDAGTDAGNRDVYPPPPYGRDAGDIFPFLAWEGYVNTDAGQLSVNLPVVAYSSQAMRRDGKRYAVVHLSEFFDPGCKLAAQDLAFLGPGWVDAGLAVTEILMTKTGSLPTPADLNSWASSYHLPVTTVIDDAGTTETFNQLGLREACLVIDLDTMAILSRIQGPLTGAGPSSVQQSVPVIQALP